ncbi:hypothetical protein QQ045_009825 [Rhodiola kirilowii]
MRGTSSRLHSKAANVLQILVSSTMYSTCSQYNQGSETIVEVIASALERLHELLEPSEFKSVLRQVLHFCTDEDACEIINFASRPEQLGGFNIRS